MGVEGLVCVSVLVIRDKDKELIVHQPLRVDILLEEIENKYRYE